MTLLALVVAVTAGAQVEPVGDLNNDGLVGVEDLMTLLSAFGNNYNELNAHPDCVPFEYDGYTYDVIQYDNMCWMAENLRTDKLSNGSGVIPFISSMEDWVNLIPFSSAQTYYDFDEDFLEEHGRLYSYAAAMQACPTGWNMPNDHYLWYRLEHEQAQLPIWELGMQNLGCRGCGTSSGHKLTDPEYGGTNETGFNAKHSGQVLVTYLYGEEDLSAYFQGVNEYAMFWTENPNPWPCDACPGAFSIDGNCTIMTRRLDSSQGNIQRSGRDSRYGLSVRCVKTLN